MLSRSRLVPVILCFLATGWISVYSQATGAAFEVDTVGDTHDVLVGDGLCSDPSGRCTLRAAIEESNATLAKDAVVFNLPHPSVIELVDGELQITASLEIVGPGARRLIIQRSTATKSTEFGVFRIGSRTIVNLRNITIRNGYAVSGGAISTEKEAIVGLFDSALLNNGAQNGGAIQINQSRLTVVRSLFASNIATNDGGALNIIGAESSVAITCSTLTNNAALNGGAIFNKGSLSLINNTITRNTGFAVASSIYSHNSGLIRVLNTLVGRDLNQVSTALDGTFISLGSNLVTDARNSVGFTNGVNGDQVSDNNAIDPMVGNLADNGGQTDTLEVLPGSPTIGRADPCVITGFCSQLPGTIIYGSKDQRQYSRSGIGGNQPEIGAFEQSSPPIVVPVTIVTLPILAPNRPISQFANSLVVLTNARTLERKYSRLNALGIARFEGVRIDDDYVVDVRAKREGVLSPIVLAFD